MVEVEAEVEEAAGQPLAIHEDVLLGQMPTPRAYDDGRSGVGQAVALPGRRREVELPLDRVPQVELALDHVLPQRRVGVLVVGEPHLGAGVERVDRHLRVGRTRDLGSPVDQPRRGLSHPPRVIRPDGCRVGKKAQRATGRQVVVPAPAPLEEAEPASVEAPVQRRKEVQCSLGQHLVVPLTHRAGHPNSCHVRLPGRCPAHHPSNLPAIPQPPGDRALVFPERTFRAAKGHPSLTNRQQYGGSAAHSGRQEIGSRWGCPRRAADSVVY